MTFFLEQHNQEFEVFNPANTRTTCLNQVVLIIFCD